MSRARKKVIKKIKPVDSRLLLEGDPSEEILQIIKTARKNVPIPDGRSSTGIWDHLINLLADGVTIVMEAKKANSFASRARALNYVIVIRKKVGVDGMADVWFEGLQEYIPDEK